MGFGWWNRQATLATDAFHCEYMHTGTYVYKCMSTWLTKNDVTG